MLWLLAAVVMTGVHRWVPQSGWLMVHLVLLGALTHAMVVWSWHFTSTLLGLPRTETSTGHQWRLGILAGGAALVLLGYPLGDWALLATGATLAGAAVLWHGVAITGRLRRGLPRRFRSSVRYYVLAAVGFATGATIGALLARPWSDEWHGRLLAAHSLAMLLGWVAPTVLGTLVTFWPTLLRARVDDHAEAWARQALPYLAGTSALVVVAALVDSPLLLGLGMFWWLLAAAWAGRGLWAPFRAKPPRHFSAGSVAAALPWFPVAVVTAAVLIWRAEPLSFGSGYARVAAVAAVGFACQILTGALAHLLPAQFGGGARVVRAGQTEFDRWATVRLVVINVGLLVCLLPIPSWVRVAVSSLVLLALVAWIVSFFRALVAMIRAKRTSPVPATQLGPEREAFTARGAVAGLVALAVVAAAGLAVDPTALADSSRVDVANAPVQRVAVVAKGMRYEPARIDIAPGTRLVIELANEDPGMSHDLWFPQGSTKRIAAGESVELDLGVLDASTQGWCTVAGHKQMGMLLDVVVSGATAAAPTVLAQVAGPRPDPSPSAGFAAKDPLLPPLSAEKVHRVRLEVVETELEVAPGIRQKAWTFNGQVPAPILHGRVGDTFEITLVNNGSMGHSVDFHAGIVSPDEVMRTIPPGESLVYRFTAVRSGIWMYHCSTMPMSNHIAAGMFGAVVIEPDGLPAVDASYVLLQHELFIDGDGRTAREVDGAKVAAKRPDLVAFNGYASQYAYRPIQVRTGQKIRVWVLDIGPNDSTSFHVVGSQFSSVWKEGAYLLDERVHAPGGSQVLSLGAAQGGFVEMTFVEPGSYTFVDHEMVDAEAGAKGVFKVEG